MIFYFLVIICLWTSPACYCTLESSSSTPKQQIDYGHLLVKDISTLRLNDRYSDVVLIVDGERLHAHRAILASRSTYFSKLFFGGFEETDKPEVELGDISLTFFKIILEYIYTGQIDLSVLKDDVVLGLMDMTIFFGVPNLDFPLTEYLRSKINVNQVCTLLTAAQLYDHEEFESASIEFIRSNARDVLKSADFLSLMPQAIEDIFNCDSVIANEIDIFRAVIRWIENRVDLDADVKIKALSVVRYPLMSDDELVEVGKSQMVSSDTISEAVRLRNTWPPDRIQFRGHLKPNENLIPQDYWRSVTYGINGRTTLQLSEPSNINHIKMKMYGDDVGDYSYYIEVSMDKCDWVRVVDYSDYICRSVQLLWFHPRLMSFIRIVGSKIFNKIFEFFEVSYNTQGRHLVNIRNGFVAPTYDVASTCMNATVLEGKNHNRRYSLLDHYVNGDLERYHSFTFHELGKGRIVVQLAQPYMLSSMRMLLWGDVDVYYSYTIEASVNNEDWTVVVDKFNELTRSWQLLQFQPMPIVFIRITGNFNTFGDDFRCVCLEAPAQGT
ncbi:BTB/POZ domain-containing protein 9-like [Adelges cooleyi]|uniref:BTB/POZ domain-containing protein 9-like n=1 Tax=Adelges cooleyi TaxID=133065 RepID=UPI00217F68C3|nr:BTB/POZ domain-containing protein 9-like [Adelges cooleyi]